MSRFRPSDVSVRGRMNTSGGVSALGKATVCVLPYEAAGN